METQVPQSVKISTDHHTMAVGIELDYGREAFIRVVWTAEEAMAVATALAAAADNLLQDSAPAEERPRGEE